MLALWSGVERNLAIGSVCVLACFKGDDGYWDYCYGYDHHEWELARDEAFEDGDTAAAA